MPLCGPRVRHNERRLPFPPFGELARGLIDRWSEVAEPMRLDRAGRTEALTVEIFEALDILAGRNAEAHLAAQLDDGFTYSWWTLLMHTLGVAVFAERSPTWALVLVERRVAKGLFNNMDVERLGGACGECDNIAPRESPAEEVAGVAEGDDRVTHLVGRVGRDATRELSDGGPRETVVNDRVVDGLPEVVERVLYLHGGLPHHEAPRPCKSWPCAKIALRRLFGI